MKAKIIYLHDTLCGWCNIARPEIVLLYEAVRDKLPFEVLHTRLFTGSFTPVVDEKWMKKVRKVDFTIGPQITGQKPSPAYLDLISQPNYKIDSTLTSLACAAISVLTPNHNFAFAEKLQSAIYDLAHDPRQEETVLTVGKSFGIEEHVFARTLHLPSTEDVALEIADKALGTGALIGQKDIPALLYVDERRTVKLVPYESKTNIDYLTQTPA